MSRTKRLSGLADVDGIYFEEDVVDGLLRQHIFP